MYYGLDICQIKLGFVQVNPKNAWKMSDIQLISYSASEVTCIM